jgi:hypothetical protein
METANRKNSRKEKLDGELTAEIGQSLSFEGYDVFCGHGNKSSKNVGKIVSTLKEQYSRDDELSQLDIAVVEHGSDKVMALVEIEETTNKPKVIIGDALGTLMGKYIYLPKRRKGKVGKWTTFIILAKGNSKHKERTRYILERVEGVKSILGSENSTIGKVIIEIFSDDKKLSTLLQSMLENVLEEEK